MGRRLGIVVVLALAAAVWSQRNRAGNVTYVASGDPGMNAARQQARSTVGTFIAALKSPRAGQSAFSVKMAFTDGQHTEHMWIAPVSYDGRTFRGAVNNVPEKVNGVRIGQQATVEPSKISDWMFVENRKLVGGYSLRALREALPPNERAAFDRKAPFVID